MEIRQTLTPDRPARFYLDGRRISRARYDSLMERAYSEGTLCNAWTRGADLGGGKFKRWNGWTISTSKQR